MPKFSVIIPVYNTYNYLERCLNSVFNQSFKDFEVIAVNDGSTDDSYKIIEKYCEKYKSKFRIVNIEKKETIGPSLARNLGVNASKGEYILFLDSDDYYETDLLKNIDYALDNNYDLVRFEIQYDKKGTKEKIKGYVSDCLYDNGISAFNEICNYSIVESPCCYVFNRKFFLKNEFVFKVNTLHEDYGLIPLVIINSGMIKCISYIGYNYVIHENSIMTSNSYDRVLKKANDFLEHFKFLKKESSKVDGDLSIFNSYIANSVILKSTTLNGSDYKNYVKELRNVGAFDMLLSDTFGRKIKKFLIKISPKIYYKLVRR